MTPPDTFIQVAADCPVGAATVPTSTRVPTPAHLIEYELLAQHPYRFTQAELVFEVHVRRLGLNKAAIAERGDEIRAELFARPRAGMRASVLPKKYGWGVHSADDLPLEVIGAVIASTPPEQFIQLHEAARQR